MANAGVVCFLGFGYHDVNIDRLKLRTLTRGAARFGTRKGMGRAEFEHARRHLGAGTADSFLQPEYDTALDYGCLLFLKNFDVLYDPLSHYFNV